MSSLMMVHGPPPICQEEDPDGAEGDLSLGRGGVKVRDDGR